jgi:hypothetical protein
MPIWRLKNGQHNKVLSEPPQTSGKKIGFQVKEKDAVYKTKKAGLPYIKGDGPFLF